MKRFEVLLKEHIDGDILKIIVDHKTGVRYLVSSCMGVSGMSPLLDKEGNPVIKKTE